ncbi:hypothetical protein E4U43_003653 [Claviceps pusilla]|uniref:Uncharacterized protein n=1 Tax=Claviceps pusilla TaxID=123648 RepID=A0A9P7SXJ8_9HYPO|nr:hypothetical protein E4U43_003653 [Claviceps pusilla]
MTDTKTTNAPLRDAARRNGRQIYIVWEKLALRPPEPAQPLLSAPTPRGPHASNMHGHEITSSDNARQVAWLDSTLSS